MFADSEFALLFSRPILTLSGVVHLVNTMVAKGCCIFPAFKARQQWTRGGNAGCKITSLDTSLREL